MSVTIPVQNTTDKILNSDIYDLTAFVDDIKKTVIDGVDNPTETLQVGMYGYLGYEFASLLQNSIVVASELANEAIPTRAKFDRNVITHALSLGIKKVQATAASMKVMLIFPEKALINNMVNDKFVLKASTPIYFDDIEFHTDYDIVINKTKLDSSTMGSRTMDYVYTAVYDMSIMNTESPIDNAYLPPIGVYAGETDNMIVVTTTIHQVEYHTIENKIVGNDNLANKTLNFTFENPLSHFTVTAYENNHDTPINLVPYYDGLYHNPYTSRKYDESRALLNDLIIQSHTGVTGTTAVVEEKYCYYQYINSNTIRIRFDPESYQPRTNANVVITVWTSQGAAGNFNYEDDITVRLSSDNYTNLFMTVKQRGDEGSYGGIDRKSVPELQKIIPKEALSRGSVTTVTDLKNYFNSINSEDSVLHIFRKEDNTLRRIYYTYQLMKDELNNVIPTNTIPIYESLPPMHTDETVGDMYVEAGDPIYFYKNQHMPISYMKKNFVGYSDSEEAITSTPVQVEGRIREQNIPSTWSSNTTGYSDGIRATAINEFRQEAIVYDNNFTEFVKENLSIYYPDVYPFEPGQVIKFSVSAIYGETNNFAQKESYEGSVISYGYYGDSDEDTNINYKPSDWTDPNQYAWLKLVVRAKNDNGELENVMFIIPYSYSWNYPVVRTATFIIDAYETYSYNAKYNPMYSKDIVQGSHIRFCVYDGNDIYSSLADTNNWYVGEVVGVSRSYTNGSGSITSITVLYLKPMDDIEESNLSFMQHTFNFPPPSAGQSHGRPLDTNDIVAIQILTDFVYTSPMNILLRDSSVAGSHRVDASFYLDMINETRYLDYTHINTRSPFQYIASFTKVIRPSWISYDRYRYTIDIDVTPNIGGDITEEIHNRTQVIAVYYRDNDMKNPICWSIGERVSSSGSVDTYRFYLYTKPFKERTSETDHIVIDQDDRLYIGQQNPYLIPLTEKRDQKQAEYDAEPEGTPRKSELAAELALLNKELYRCINFGYRPHTADVIDELGIRMDLNTHMRIYTLYKYSGYTPHDGNPGKLMDELTQSYFYGTGLDESIVSIVGTPLKDIIPPDFEFYQNKGESDPVETYAMQDLVLTNVYDSSDGINLLHNYSNLMNSYVHMVDLGEDIYDDSKDNKRHNYGYIINRVPCIRYFYLNEEYKIRDFIREMKRKILYVLDAIEPLETTFGLDYKFFNTYGPSNMYYTTEGGIRSEESIDNVALSLTFRTKFYNEDNDAATIIPQIKDTIKTYIENIEELNDIHFPNLTTEIESKFSQYIVFFEYVGFNKYNATMQHIITDENMEMLNVVPEFLNVNTDDSTGTSFISIEIVS